MSILVTGANGFVGRALCAVLCRTDARVTGVTRRPILLPDTVLPEVLADVPFSTMDWRALLAGHRIVVHTVARVHVMNDSSTDPLSSFREVNTAGTLSIARQAAAAGVRRFVFLSSVKVNGEETEAGRAFRISDQPAPQDPYGISKHEAELGLREIARNTGMEVTIVRPPLVYGPGVKANFHSLMRAIARGMPLPLGSVTANRRSLVALDNLVDLLVTCVDHPAAANQTFLVSDGEDLSTADLLRRMGRAMNRPARLLPCPTALLQLGAGMLGKTAVAQRLLGNLQVDIAHTRTTLGWTPPISVDEGLRRAAEGLERR